MTTTEIDRNSFAAFADHIASTFGLTVDDLSCDAENVLRRNFRAGVMHEFETFRGADGRLYIRFDA